MDSKNQKSYNLVELMSLEERFRTHLINSLVGFKSVCLIGTISDNNKTNLAIFNSIVHIGASPPLIGFIVRPDCVDRHTLANILQSKFYTINHINEAIFEQAHQTSARYPKGVSEFEITNLEEEYKGSFLAPFVKESSIQLGIEFKERVNLAINGTCLIIGEIQHVYFQKDCICDDGFVDIEKAKSITCSGLDRYHQTKHLSRLSYAQVDTTPSEIGLKYMFDAEGNFSV